MICQRMTLQIVDKKAKRCVFFHPLQLCYQLFLSKMMAKQTGKNDIGFFVKNNCFVIAHKPCCALLQSRLCFGKLNAFFFYVYTRKTNFYTFVFAPIFNGKQVI